jgi:hypothetical protein
MLNDKFIILHYQRSPTITDGGIPIEILTSKLPLLATVPVPILDPTTPIAPRLSLLVIVGAIAILSLRL